MSEYGDRIERLARRAREARADVEQPSDPPDEDAAMTALREGVGPAVSVYVEARTGDGPLTRFDADEFERLERALNDWLAVYAAHHGESVDPDVTVRTAAELLVDTHDVGDTAAVLTGVPRDRTTANNH